MDNRNEVVEIDLVQLFLLCLRKWKVILLTAVVFALIIGGYKGFSGLSKVETETSTEENDSAQDKLTQYDNALSSYKAQLERLNETLEKNQVYERESIIMKMNPNDYFTASSTYYISTDYKIMPDMTYQNIDYQSDVVQAYKSYLASSECLSYVRSRLTEKIPTKYLSELISISVNGRGVLWIRVYGDTAQRTSEILAAMNEAVDYYRGEINAKVHEHKLDVLENSRAENSAGSDDSGEGSSNYVADKQKSFSDSQNTLTNQIATLYDKYAKLSDTEVTVEESKGLTKSGAVKNGIKFGVIGLFLGAFLAAGLISIKSILEDKINNAGEISRIFGLRIFGDYKSGAMEKGFGKLLYKMSYGDALADKDKFFEVAAANVKTFISAFIDEDIKEISLVGRIDFEAINNIVKSVNEINGDETVKLAGDIINDAEAINAIRDVKYTLIVADRNTSKKDLRSQLEKLKGLKKSVAGVLLFD